jgi:hypothetical protein
MAPEKEDPDSLIPDPDLDPEIHKLSVGKENFRIKMRIILHKRLSSSRGCIQSPRENIQLYEITQFFSLWGPGLQTLLYDWI